MINRHPLDQLSLEEIQAACDIVKKQQSLTDDFRFTTTMLHEPPQSDVLKFKEGDTFDRLAFVCVFNSKKDNQVFEAIVNLTQKSVHDWKHIPGVQPPILSSDYHKCEQIVKAHTPWREAMKKRGLTDTEIDKIQIDAFSAGNFGIAKEAGKRLVRAVSYYREDIKDNGYARPIEGIVAVVDLINETILELIDDGLCTPIPKTKINYDSASYPQQRSDMKSLVIIQQAGPSFKVEGTKVTWSDLEFRVSFNDREGVVLNQISCLDGGQKRPIVYRASITDMLVPYADPSVSHYWKSAFDAGEYGLGKFANQLTLGCDCLGEIYYFDIPAVNDYGKAFLMKNAICMHEEDAGILWKHNEFRTGISEVRRARELVVSWFATIGNYDYGFYWRLTQDCRINLDIKLTGIVQTAAIFPGANYQWGGKLTQELAAPTHQHFFNVRLHMMVDGENNSISEQELHALPLSDTNQYGNAFGVRERQLETEADAIRDANAGCGRSWKIYNSSFTNSVSQPTAYKLEIPQAPLLLSHPESSFAARGAFATHHLWITPYDPHEKYATGDYPNQSSGGAGLPSYLNKKLALKNTSLVAWVTAGVTHVVSSEEFPVMPAATLSLKLLRPYGFFSSNKTMNLPPSRHQKSAEESCCAASQATSSAGTIALKK